MLGGGERGEFDLGDVQVIDAVRAGAIPATIAASLPAGFGPAEATIVWVNATLAATSWDSPDRSASAITGAKPRTRHEVLVVKV